MYIHVRVIAGSREEKVIKEKDDHFVMSVREEAERNMANGRVLEIIQELYPGKSVRIINGHHHPKKLIAVD